MVIIYLLKYWHLIALALLAAYIGFLEVKNASLTSRINEQSATLQLQENTIESLKTSIDEQNKAIQNLKDFQDKKQKDAEKELQIAKDTANVWKKKATTIISLPKPANKSSCDAANDLINETIK